MRGLPYDGDYQWDDERIYCSELVMKAVLRATNVALAPPRTFSLREHVTAIAQLTHGHLTESTFIVAPIDLARSDLVTRIGGDLPADEVAFGP
jgi:Permuted papain-like amidase enzyme, YaeF/YiiX, C92 family